MRTRMVIGALVLTVAANGLAQQTQPAKLAPEELVKQGKLAEAAEKYLSWAGGAANDFNRSLSLSSAAGLYAKLRRPDDAKAAYAQLLDLKRPEPFRLARAAEWLARRALDQDKPDEALACLDRALEQPDLAGPPRAVLLVRKGDILAGRKQDANAAEAVYREAADLKRPNALEKLIRLRRAAKASDDELLGLYLRGAADRTFALAGSDYFARKGDADRRDKLLVAYLSACQAPTPDVQVLRRIIPNGSPTRLWFDTAQAVLTGYRAALAAKEGRVRVEALQAMADQLTRGGGQKVLAVSDGEKALAAKLASAPAFALQDWYVAMLGGRYAKAARLAFENSKQAEGDLAFGRWVLSVSAAVRCLDQCYNGRALEYVKWVNGDKSVTANPIADLLEGTD